MAFRRNFKRTGRTGWARRPALPTRRTARAIVRKAGPLETAFFTDSTLSGYGDNAPTTYSPQGSIFTQTIWQIFGPNDYDQDGSGKSKVFVRKAQVNLFTFRPQNLDSTLVYEYQGNFFGLMLVAADQPNIDHNFDPAINAANPWGSQASLQAYQELPKGVRVVHRSWHKADSRPLASIDVSAGANTYMNTVMAHNPTSLIYTLRAKNFWLREPESLWMICTRICMKSAAQSEAGIGPWAGWHSSQVSSARY